MLRAEDNQQNQDIFILKKFRISFRHRFRILLILLEDSRLVKQGQTSKKKNNI